MDKSALAQTQRKLSRGKSFQSSRGIFSRASVKKTDTHPFGEPQPPQDHHSSGDTASFVGRGKEQGSSLSEDYHSQPRVILPSRSIIPDPLNELPAWYAQTVEGAPTTPTQFRSRYPMHNPVGPRWYKNWHLSPTSLQNRPPSFFSPSFPPMAASMDRGQDQKLPGPSRTPSGSPLPTPTSSQTRIHDVRVRTRKLSQTAQDNVDMLDGTDPWGTNWHHQSPYDVGTDRVSPISPDIASENPVTFKSRRMSFNTGSRHKTVTPSPLSQSTPAVHLPSAAHIPRRPSKDRKPFQGLFTSTHAPGSSSKRVSEPPSISNPLDRPLKRGSSLGPSMSSLSEKKEKRGSILGRLVKRFSVLRKPDRNFSTTHLASVETGSALHGRPSIDTLPVAPSFLHKPSLHHIGSADVSRRIPPPAFGDEPPTLTITGIHNDDTISIPSFEETYQPIGKLTIANPDEPSLSQQDELDPVPPVLLDSNDTAAGIATVLDRPTSSAPPTNLLDTPIQHRLSTILSVDAPGTSPSPPLPELPPPTPPALQALMPEPLPSLAPQVTPASTPEIAFLSSPKVPNKEQTLPPSSLPTARELPSADEVQLARASIVVNPPTPHAPTILISSQPHPPSVPSPVPSPERRESTTSDVRGQHDSSPTKRSESHRVKPSSSSTKSRRTETFKLVRSPSGNVQPVGEGFVVEGEHWGVVESSTDPKKGRKERSKSSDSDAAPPKKETRKTDRGSTDDPSDRQKDKGRERHRRSVNGKSGSDQVVRSSTHSDADTVRQVAPERRRSGIREREPDGGTDSLRSTQTPLIPPRRSLKSTPSQPTPRRERRSSGSATRPSSEFQSVADINALKAKEAWDLERLWKGRSMVYGPDGTTVLSTRPTIGSDSRPTTIMSPELHRATSIPSVGDLQHAATMPAPHGSSHTYFMIQTPTNGASSYDHSLLSNPGQSPSKSHITRPEYANLYRSFPDAVPFLSPTDSLPNPLPDPPRLSTYKPPPLPASIAGSGDGPSSVDYWAKYAGVATTTSH